MIAAGMASGRITSTTYSNRLPMAQWYSGLLRAVSIVNTDNLATVKGFIDNAVAGGYVAALLFHQIVTPADTTTKWPVADFQALVDYIIAQHIQPLTITQFYALENGPLTLRQPS